ncbi:Zn(II)2Cys6 transcription factor [Fonsecaea pedrosoi]|nr:Zn(II)2Cys6 transcription factor [Fonsecaea pedrosoi]
MDTATPGVEYADRACNSCRQRRVKCDKRLPACFRCEKLGRPCTGYDLERKFLDEGIKVRRKYDGNFQSPDFSRVVVSNSPRAPAAMAAAVPDRRINLPPIHNIPSISQVKSPPISSAPNLPSIQGVSDRASIPNIQFPAFGLLNQQSPDFNIFPNTPPQPAISAPPPSSTSSTFQYAATPPQFPDYGQYSHQEHPTAKLLHGKPQYAPSDLDSSVSEDYFDLDIETYYAKGNNACGFIPGLPVILTDNNVPESDDDFLTSDFASISGRSSVYDGSEGTRSSRPEYSQKYLHERTTELACLTRHFVQSVSPSMDLFDLDTYFSRIVPLKAVQNVMLRSAMAAVAANQIGQMMANHSPLEDLQHLLPFIGEDGALQHTDWFYKAANYYDRGISYLRIFLQRWLSDTNKEGLTGHASRYNDPRTLSEPSNNTALGVSPNKRRRISRTQSSDGADMEALVAAISVFSLYESLDNFTDDWSQHLDGFKALLESKILPHAALSVPRPRASPFISMKAGRAAFWNFARADYLAAYVNHSKTRLDPDNLTMWKAAGLPVMDDGTLNYNDPSTPINAVVTYQPGDREDLVSCTLIWIVLRTMNFIAPQEDAAPSLSGTPRVFDSPGTNAKAASEPGTPGGTQPRIARWKQLRRQLEDWYDNLPFTFQPYAIAAAGAQQPSDLLPDGRPRFARLFFSVPMCAAALQLYHFAQILLLLNQPVDDQDARHPANRLRMFRQVAEESEHHSRQICGIALGKPPPAVSRQMVHSLYLAGSCFEEKEDRTVVLELLDNIAKETGCPTAHRIKELKEQWGWQDDTVREIA